MADVTICILTYGDHAPLARRVIESIRMFCPRPAYELVVGGNAVGRDTLDYMRDMESSGAVDRFVHSDVNLNKCPMMRRMFETVQTEFIWWFDDDSYVTSSGAWEQWLGAARAAMPTTVMWGELYRCNATKDFTDLEDVIGFVRRASWYGGLPPPSWWPGGKGEFNYQNHDCGDGSWDFIVGGCWLIRTAAIRALDWPDRRLVKLGDDVFLGEAIRQQGWELGNIGSPGVLINTETRRGDRGSCGVSDKNDPVRIQV